MKIRKRDLEPSLLPPPITLTPEQLSAVASDTGAALGGGMYLPIIAGGYPIFTPALSAVAVASLAI